MADHKVSLEIPKEIEVGNADLKIESRAVAIGLEH